MSPPAVAPARTRDRQPTGAGYHLALLVGGCRVSGCRVGGCDTPLLQVPCLTHRHLSACRRHPTMTCTASTIAIDDWSFTSGVIGDPGSNPVTSDESLGASSKLCEDLHGPVATEQQRRSAKAARKLCRGHPRSEPPGSCTRKGRQKGLGRFASPLACACREVLELLNASCGGSSAL